MSKIRIPILIISMVLVGLIGSLATYFSMQATGNIKPEKIKLTYNIKDELKEYDGIPLEVTTDDITLTEGLLLDGHYAKVINSNTLTNVGIIEANPVINIFDNQGFNVTDYYEINLGNPKLEITPKTVSFKIESSKEMIYNGNAFMPDLYTLISGSLLDGHQYYPRIEGGITEPSEINNTKVSSYIFDAYGNDVTKNYNIKVELGDLIILKRSIVVKPKDLEFTYDGTEKTCSEIEVIQGELVDGHKISSSIQGSLLIAGSISTSITDLNIFDNNGINVTENYSITLNEGDLRVLPKEITITSSSKSKVYDTFELTSSDYTVEGLISTDTIQSVVFAETARRVDVGTTKNQIMNQTIINSLGIDVSDCYKVNYKFGDLTITKAPLTLYAKDDEKIYDGTPLTRETVSLLQAEDLKSYDGLLNSEIINFRYSGQIVDAGTAVNTIRDVRILSNDTDVTNNYEINIVTGKLEIKPRNLIVTGESAIKEYDGEELNLDDSYLPIDQYGLVDKNVEEPIVVIYTSRLTEVGKITSYFEVTEIKNDNLSNYNIEYVYGTLEVTKIKLTLTAKSANKQYDGTPLTLVDDTELAAQTGLLIQHNVLFNYEGSITNAGTTKNNITNIKVMEGRNNVTNNYDILIVEGTLEITKRPLTLTAESKTKIYDGEALTMQGGAYKLPEENIIGLVNGQNVIVNYSGSITNAGEVDNSIIDVIIQNGDRNSYEIEYVNGTLTINKATLTLVAKSYEKIYDGTPLTMEGKIYSAAYLDFIEGLAKTDNIQFQYVGSQKVAGVSELVIDGVIITNNGNDMLNNYDLENSTFVNGTLTVTKKALTITAPKIEKVYDSEALTVDKTQITNVGLVDTDTITTYQTIGRIKNVGSCDAIITAVNIVNNGEDVTNCYEITFINGTLTVTKRDIKITSPSDEFVYNGQNQTSNKDLQIENIVTGEQINLIKLNSITQVGSIVNEISIYDIEMINGNIDNYNISFVYGTLTVTPQELVIKPFVIQKEFDGVAFNKFELTEANYEVKGLVAGETLTCNGQQKGDLVFGNDKYEIVDIVISGFTHSSINNYNINLVEGNLNIVKRNANVSLRNLTASYTGGNPYENIVFGKNDLFTYQGLELFEFSYTINVLNFNCGTNNYTIDCEIKYNGLNVNDKVELTIANNPTITINKKSIIYTLNDLQHTYNGERPFNDKEFTRNDLYIDGLDSKFTFTYIINTQALNVGSSQYTIVPRILLDNVDVTENFEPIQRGTASITIIPKNLTLEARSAVATYTGAQLTIRGSINDDLNRIDGLILNHTINFTYTASGINVGIYENSINVISILDEQNNNVTNNYKVTIVKGTLEITKKSVSIAFKSTRITAVYSGNDITLTSNQMKLLDDQSTEITDITVIPLEYTKINNSSLRFMQVYNARLIENGIDVTNNYEIDYSATAQVMFDPRPVIFKVNDLTVTVGQVLRVEELFELSNQTPLVSGDYIDTRYANTFTVLATTKINDIYNFILNNTSIMSNDYEMQYDCYEIITSGGSITII